MIKSNLPFRIGIFLWFYRLSVFAHPCGQDSLSSNLSVNPGFETGTLTGWSAAGNPTLQVVAGTVKTGSYSCYVSNRSSVSDGPAQNIMPFVGEGKLYCISAWIRSTDIEKNFRMTLKKVDGANTTFITISQVAVDHSQWVQISGMYEHTVTGTLKELTLFFEQPYDVNNFYIDDLSIVEIPKTSDWKKKTSDGINKNRKGPFCFSVGLHDASSPWPVAVNGATIKIRQLKHDFAFGSCIANYFGDPNYKSFFKNHFEWAVCENESKWKHNEPSQGNVSYSTADMIYDFCQQQNIKMRGHSLYWEVEHWVQDWVKNLSTEALRTAVSSRMNSAANHFKGKFLHWDVNNEMLHGNFYRSRLGDSIAVWMFKEAKKIDPSLKLFVNDFHVLSEGETYSYMNQIKKLQAQGAPVGAIGCQSHFDKVDVSYDILKHRLDTLASFNLPVWATEFDVVEPDEYRRADKLEKFYRTLFSHPATEGIMMWGFWANAHWRGPDAAIVNADWTLNEAGRRYESLMQEWRTDTLLYSSSAIISYTRAFYGQYEITISYPGYQTIIDTLFLHKKANQDECDVHQYTLLPDSNISSLPAYFPMVYDMPRATPVLHDSADKGITELRIHAYPNPVSDKLTVSLENAEEGNPVTLILTDFSGRILLRKTTSSAALQELSLAPFTQGVYLLYAYTPNRISRTLITKQKN